MKKVILFDIDHTIIDTRKLRKYTKDSLIKAALIKPSILNTIEKKYSDSLTELNQFEPNNYLKYISKFTHASFSTLQVASYGRDDLYKKSLFSNTVKVLKSLSRSYFLGIFSEGDKNYQISKLVKASIIQYFNTNYIFIDKNKLSSRIIRNLPDQAVIIDDDKKILEALLEKTDIVPMWFTHNVGVSPNFQKISSLEQIESILNIYYSGKTF